MHDSIIMKILDSNSDLVCQFFDSLLTNFEASILDVVEEILSLHVFQNNVVVVLVFKQINQCYNVWMLTHFENVYFSSLLINFYWLHIFLVDCLYCNFLPCFLMDCKLHKSELTLAEVTFEIVEVEEVRVA